jgi:methyltransferase-like protein/2-polyprenyl-3-methyl-5-hydroxy-6-metoxy-1,4-benzoquinol methylase
MSSLPQTPSIPQSSAAAGNAPVLAAQKAYDSVPYCSYPIPASHPDRLYAAARLFGLDPVIPDNARILEIGCAGGGNLLPIASTLPKSKCVGIEISPVQCENGKIAIQFTGMKNVDIRQASVTEIAKEFGEFDYIVCHGVFSWVPPHVREAILRVCSDNLSPKGIAYISYNVLPGWYLRGMTRGMMLEHVKSIANPTERVAQARSLMNFLVESNKNSNTGHATYLRSEAEILAKSPDHYLFHEHLEDINVPFYFRSFIEEASKFGLQYLSESCIPTIWPQNLSPEACKVIETITDEVTRGHYMDCVLGRTFRETLLVHKSVEIKRSIEADRFAEAKFYGSYELRPELAEGDQRVYKTYKGGHINTSGASWEIAMKKMTEAFPCALSLDEIYSAVEEENSKLDKPEPVDRGKLLTTLILGTMSGWVEFQYTPNRMKSKVPKFPKVTAWASSQAQASGFITNLRHEFISIHDVHRQIIPLLNGSNDLESIISQVKVRIDTGLMKIDVKGLNPGGDAVAREVSRTALEYLASRSLLWNDASE